MELFTIVGLISLTALLWLNFLAMLSIKYDATLENAQKVGQSMIVWLIPFVGASLVLKFVYEHSPEAIPKSWIPWPFKDMIFGTERKQYRDTGGVEVDSPYSRGGSSGRDQSSSSDGGDSGGD